MDIYIITAVSEGIKFELLVNDIVMLSNYSGEYEDEFNKVNASLSPGKNQVTLRACRVFPSTSFPKLLLKLTKGQKGEKLGSDSRLAEMGIPPDLDVSELKEWTEISSFEFEVDNNFSPIWQAASTKAPSPKDAMAVLKYLAEMLHERDADRFVKMFDAKLKDAAQAFGFSKEQLEDGMFGMLEECMMEDNFTPILPDPELLTIMPQANGKLYTLLNDNNEPALQASFGDGDVMPFDVHISDIDGKWVISR